MSIGINASNLSTEGLAIEIATAAGKDIRIVLGQSGGVTGRYEQDTGRIGLREIAAHQLTLQALLLPLAGGTLRADSPSILAGLFIDAELGGGRPFTGRVTLASADAHVSFQRGPLTAGGRLRLGTTLYERSELAGQHARVESLEVEGLRLELQGQTTLQVEQLSLYGARFSVDPSGSIALRCDSARAGAIILSQGERSLQLRGIEWPSGLELQGDALRWSELTLDRLHVALPELPRRRASATAARSPSGQRAALDLPLLDHLEGQLDLDLLVDVRIPILPDRRATHAIRLPIRQGAINFHQLERCLAGLEDALLDFEVNEEGLILEFDPIPGIRRDNVTLVTWPLAGEDHTLAATEQRIRLRRLLDYRLSPKLAGSGHPSPGGHSQGPSALRALRVADISITLKLGGPSVQPLPGLGTLRLGGAPGEASIGELKLSGEFEHKPEAPPSATELRLDVRDLLLGASIADADGRRVEVERLAVGQIDKARIGMLGVEPCSLGLDAARLRLAGVELSGWFRRGRGA